MRIINRAFGLTLFVGSAGVAALLMVLLIRYWLGVPLGELRLNAIISAGALSLVLVVAIVGSADEKEK